MNSTLARRGVGIAIGLVLLAGVLALGSRPTGAPSPEATVAADSRVAARRDVGSVVVLLTARRSDLHVVVAYHESKGWFSVPVDPVPRTVATTWTSTKGGGSVPALSMAYGSASDPAVRVTWDDGAVDHAEVGRDGLWLVARRGEARIARVERLAADGTVVATEDAP